MDRERHTALVVEDQPHVREATAAVLRRHGYRVSAAATGARGLALMREVRPDVVVLDYSLPDMTGADLLHAARHDPALRDMRSVVYSGHPFEELACCFQAAGPDAMLEKPASPEGLMRAVRSVLNAGRSPGEAHVNTRPHPAGGPRERREARHRAAPSLPFLEPLRLEPTS